MSAVWVIFLDNDGTSQEQMHILSGQFGFDGALGTDLYPVMH
jgi:hypothetical protein